MSLIIPKPYHICDFCGREINDLERRYIIKKKYMANKTGRVDGWSEKTKNLEMCFHCMRDFRQLIAGKRKRCKR